MPYQWNYRDHVQAARNREWTQFLNSVAAASARDLQTMLLVLTNELLEQYTLSEEVRVIRRLREYLEGL